MQSKRFVLALVAGLATIGAQAVNGAAAAISEIALTGKVTSAKEGAMEYDRHPVDPRMWKPKAGARSQ